MYPKTPNKSFSERAKSCEPRGSNFITAEGILRLSCECGCLKRLIWKRGGFSSSESSAMKELILRRKT